MSTVLGNRGEKRVVLETSTKIAGEEMWVQIKTALLAEDIDTLLPALENPGEDKKKVAYIIMSNAIIDWNFTDATGNKAAITPENIAKVPFDDLNKLEDDINWMSQLDRIKKNKSSDTSQVEVPAQPTPPLNTSS
jgi:hypothetical protein